MLKCTFLFLIYFLIKNINKNIKYLCTVNIEINIFTINIISNYNNNNLFLSSHDLFCFYYIFPVINMSLTLEINDALLSIIHI